MDLGYSRSYSLHPIQSTQWFYSNSDLAFIFVSTPSSPLSRHGHKLLLVAPVIEGLLGGWSTLQSATSAYISDCTSSGSRAQVFSRFTGVFYLGFSLGPAVGGWVIANGLPIPWLNVLLKPQKTVTGVFWISVFFSLVNLLLVVFVFPESLSKEKREKSKKKDAKGNKGKQRARNDDEETVGGVVEESLPILQMPVGNGAASSDEEESSASSSSVSLAPRQEEQSRQGTLTKFLSPLAVFLPVTVLDPYGLGRKRKDWSLTLLAGALFGVMLATVSTSSGSTFCVARRNSGVSAVPSFRPSIYEPERLFTFDSNRPSFGLVGWDGWGIQIG